MRYDRRGFGRNDKTRTGYDYDTLADDLGHLLTELGLNDASLVGFSMGGGEVARYISRYGEQRLRSVVFAAAVTPYLAQTEDNPDGPLTKDLGDEMTEGLTNDRDAFFDQFTTQFFSVDGVLQVSERQRGQALALAHQSDQKAALGCLEAFGTTDFRDDLTKISVPTLVVHGDGDATVPFEGSGARTHAAIPHSTLQVVHGAPHGLNVSHRDAFNEILTAFLSR